MTTGRIFCLLLITFVGAGNQHAQTRGSIAGTVVSATGAETVQGAIITARLQGPDGGSSKMTASGPEGRFGFSGLPAGQYEFRVRKSGYGEMLGGIPRVNLSRNEQSEGLLVRLWPSAAITGRALDPEGEVVADSQVRAYAVRYGPVGVYWSLAARALSDDLGEYRLFGLSAGKYVLRVWPPAGGPAGQFYTDTVGTFYPRVTSPSQALPVEARWGADVTGVDLELVSGPAHSITGSVTDAATGGRCALCFVEAVQVDGSIQVSLPHPGRTSREGLFALTGLAPGDYKLIAQRGRDSGLVGQVDVSVRDGNVSAVELVVGVRQQVTGQIVLEEPPDGLDVSGWVVQLTPIGLPDTWPAGQAKVGENLDFVLTAPPARYEIAVNNLPEGAYLKSLRFGGRALATPKLTITGDAAVNGLQAVIAFDAATIQGVVQARGSRDDGETVEANVYLIPEDGSAAYSRSQRVATAEDGSFRLGSIVPGRYRLYALPRGSAAAILDPAVQASLRNLMESVDVDAGESLVLELRTAKR